MTPLAGCRAGLVVLALSTPLAVSAQAADQLQIGWSDTAACARPALLESEVTRLLGPGSPAKGTLRFDVRVSQLAATGRYTLTLSVEGRDHQAQREVQLESCRDVQEAVALLIATAIDPTAVLRAAPPPPPAPPPAPPPERESPALVRSPRPWRWSLVGGAAWDYRTLPRATLGPLLGVLLDVPHVRLSVEARYLAPRYIEYADGELEITLDLFSAVLGATYPFQLASFISLGPSVAVEVGLLRVDSERETQRPVWGEVLAGPVLALFARERVGLELGVWLGAPILPPKFKIAGEGDAFAETAKWTWRTTAALRVSLGPKEQATAGHR